VEGLRARLDERFNVLTAGARVVLRRHQTLRSTLEWSHGLLTPDERTVFRRLGVFAGSFTLESAQYVVTDESIDAWAALDHLGALVDKSLVLAEGDPARYPCWRQRARSWSACRSRRDGAHAEAACRGADRIALRLRKRRSAG
jgi:predicted ATPase